MMPKSDTITAITKLNPSADPEFLAQFSSEELTEYLHRLTKVRGVSASADSLLRSLRSVVSAEAAAAE